MIYRSMSDLDQLNAIKNIQYISKLDSSIEKDRKEIERFIFQYLSFDDLEDIIHIQDSTRMTAKKLSMIRNASDLKREEP